MRYRQYLATLVNEDALTEQRRAKEIIIAVAKKHRLVPEVVTGPSRNRKVVAARDEAVQAIRVRCPRMFLKEIGCYFGLHHSSVICILRKNGYTPGQHYGLRFVESRVSSDGNLGLQ